MNITSIDQKESMLRNFVSSIDKELVFWLLTIIDGSLKLKKIPFMFSCLPTLL